MSGSYSGIHLKGLTVMWFTEVVVNFPCLGYQLLSDGCCRHGRMHHTCQSASPPPTSPFRRESTPRSHHGILTWHRRERGCASGAHLQTPFPLWWQILPELAPICESRRGVLYESNSPVICLSQMEPRGVRRPRLVAAVPLSLVSQMRSAYCTEAEVSCRWPGVIR